MSRGVRLALDCPIVPFSFGVIHYNLGLSLKSTGKIDAFEILILRWPIGTYMFSLFPTVLLRLFTF